MWTPAAAAEPASAPQPTSDQGVIYYAEPDPFARQHRLQGTRVGEHGCAFSLVGTSSGSAVAQSESVRYDQLSFDPQRCVAVIEIDRVSDAAPETKPGQGRESDGGGAASGGGEDGGPIPSDAGSQLQASPCENPHRDTSRFYTHDACIHSWFEDPPGLHVNDQTNEVQWNPGNGCATDGLAYGSWYSQWLSGSGWQELENNYLPAAGCGDVTSHNEALFGNTAFCGGIFAVFTRYNQRITGLADNRYRWEVRWDTNGVCSGLLSFHTEANP